MDHVYAFVIMLYFLNVDVCNQFPYLFQWILAVFYSLFFLIRREYFFLLLHERLKISDFTDIRWLYMIIILIELIMETLIAFTWFEHVYLLKFPSYNFLKLELTLRRLLIVVSQVTFKEVVFCINWKDIFVVLGRYAFASLCKHILIILLGLSLMVFMLCVFKVSYWIVGGWEISLVILLNVLVSIFIVLIIKIKMRNFFVWVNVYILIL